MKSFGLSLAERRYRVKKNPIQLSPVECSHGRSDRQFESVVSI
jgi:hypothetical protein